MKKLTIPFHSIFKNKISDDKNFSSYLNSRYKLRPINTSLKIAVIYGVLGSLWILFSGKILYSMFPDSDNLYNYELYKGWFYVFLTTLLIFYLVLKNLQLFDKARKKLWKNYDELNSAHDELLNLKEELSQLAYNDSLTNLPNKVAFEKRMKFILSQYSKQKIAFVYMDIDNFKNINDTLGHDAGDELLIQISNILREQIQLPNYVARISGDEFVVTFHNIIDNHDVEEMLNNLLLSLRKTWIIRGIEFFISFSIGVTLYPDDGTNVNILLRNADTAMYSVKKKTKDSIIFYSCKMHEDNIRRIEMANDLRNAIKNNELTLLYQPIKSLEHERIVGVEALIRWNHPTKGLISPMEFIPLAEECGLIHDIDKWVLKTAFYQKREWESKNLPNIKVSVNVSGISLIMDGLVEEVKNLLAETKIRCNELLIEVTETALIENIDTSVNILNNIRNLGIKIALDDFGTGYSSLTYLEKLPIDIVKLDRLFVKDMFNQSHVNIIVNTIIKLTHDLNLKITAEGIETEHQLVYLKSNSCDFGQGYLFSKPITKEELETQLMNYIQ